MGLYWLMREGDVVCIGRAPHSSVVVGGAGTGGRGTGGLEGAPHSVSGRATEHSHCVGWANS